MYGLTLENLTGEGLLDYLQTATDEQRNISSYRPQGYFVVYMKVLDKDARVKIIHISSKAFCIVCGCQQLEFVVGRNSGVLLKFHGIS